MTAPVPTTVPVRDLLVWCEPCAGYVSPRVDYRGDRAARFGGPWWALLCPHDGTPLGGWNA